MPHVMGLTGAEVSPIAWVKRSAHRRHLLNVLQTIFPRATGSQMTELAKALFDFDSSEVPSFSRRTAHAPFPPSAMHAKVILPAFLRASIFLQSFLR